MHGANSFLQKEAAVFHRLWQNRTLTTSQGTCKIILHVMQKTIYIRLTHQFLQKYKLSFQLTCAGSLLCAKAKITAHCLAISLEQTRLVYSSLPANILGLFAGHCRLPVLYSMRICFQNSGSSCPTRQKPILSIPRSLYIRHLMNKEYSSSK